ncbi:ATPase P [Geoalkalibacter ferrihydriticus DSM 17813]|uniref:P-type Zn(2+) transporter n=2 Tax=Geoalkalibacter ferrihydriticus TaxID=392333 RepID=A0A0C2DXJ2_9BACT|nr:ATPase P [Geoalkalibacter ferrihydriticus DSM 17813]
MPSLKSMDLRIKGLDCAECARHVRQAVEAVPGVASVDVLMAAQKALIRFDPAQTDPARIRRAVEQAGYALEQQSADDASDTPLGDFSRRVLILFGGVFGTVLFVVVVGEWFGLLEAVTRQVPWPLWLLVIGLGGYPIFRNVVKAAWQGRIIAHTLMTFGMTAAIVVGEWPAATIVVFFMRIGEYVESFAAERARHAVKALAALSPQTARVERNGVEIEVPAEEVSIGEAVIVRPGEKIPVDGEVIGGQATVDQSAITGESMPVEAAPGTQVFASSIARLGSLRIQTLKIGADTTFGRVVTLVEEAESRRGEVQRLADRFSSYFLPIVLTIAALTFFFTRNALATAAVLVVACSCSFALATPIAMIASIGAAARQGILIKGGKYLEILKRADVLLIDKTGTLTLGRPQITDIVPLDDLSAEEILSLAAAAERDSEHPLAEAVRLTAAARGVPVEKPQEFEAVPGQGVRARIAGREVVVGNSSMIPEGARLPEAVDLLEQGKTLLFVSLEGKIVGMLAAADTIREEVPAAFAQIRALGLHQVELITGDNPQAAASLAKPLGIAYRASLLPQDKIAIVRAYQQQGHIVVMVGDGVNDAPALAQADVGIAMGAAGSDIAIEAAHMALMREDWRLVPELFAISRRTLGVVHLNLGFTAVYNLAGLSLAATGLLPLPLAAALQAIPDIGILLNSSRLLKPYGNGNVPAA